MSSFSWAGIGHLLPGSSAKGPSRLKLRYQLSVFLSGQVIKERFTYKLLHVGIIHILEVVGLTSPLSC